MRHEGCSRPWTYNATIAGKRKHHPAVARHAEEPAVPDTDKDKRKQAECSGFAEDVHEYLKYGLSVVARDGPVEVLNREKERHQHEEAKQGAETNAGYHSDGGTP